MHQPAAKLPSHTEARRLDALHGYGILDTPAEAAFDDITRIAATVCGTPIAVVNLIDAARQWFKSEIGLGVRETPLDTSICAHAILEHDFLEVADTTRDPRFAENPLVTGDPGLRFYAGALLKTADGLPLGTVCVLDTVPRALAPGHADVLRALARQVMVQLELRRMLADADLQDAHRARVLATAGHDLKAPLRSALYAISRVRGALQDDAQADRLRSAEQDLGDIGRVFGDLVAASTGRGGPAAPPLGPVRVGDVLESVRRGWERAASRKGIVLALGDSVDCAALSNTALLETLVGNLVSNAVKYTPAGGRVMLGCSRDGDRVRIEVADSGIGMEAAHVEGYFAAFRQADVASEGIGMGLWIVRRTAEVLSATIDVDSTPGTGTRVGVSLPAN